MQWVDRSVYAALAVVVVLALAYFNVNQSLMGNMYVYLGIVPLLTYTLVRFLYSRRS